MMKRSIYIAFISLILFGTSIAGPGYVSRDCPYAGAKESITLDWSFTRNWFFTVSYIRKKRSGWFYGYRWERHTSGGWEHTWRSYAGQFGRLLGNYYYSGVYGYHYWYNAKARRYERRRKYVTSCNGESWGYNNW